MTHRARDYAEVPENDTCQDCLGGGSSTLRKASLETLRWDDPRMLIFILNGSQWDVKCDNSCLQVFANDS